MRKKISTGFICLAVLLLFAGAISVFELNRMRSKTREIIELNSHIMALAERMLDALQIQNTAVIKMIVSEDAAPANGYGSGMENFGRALEDASSLTGEASVAAIRLADANYRNVIAGYANEELELDMAWFAGIYLNAYYLLDKAVNDYFSAPASPVEERTSRLESDVYKTITPSIVTFMVGIMIVLMLFFFVDAYYVRPLIKINAGLKRYLQAGIRSDDSFETSDELAELKESIAEIIERSKH